jgi:hypothetical protein
MKNAKWDAPLQTKEISNEIFDTRKSNEFGSAWLQRFEDRAIAILGIL